MSCLSSSGLTQKGTVSLMCQCVDSEMHGILFFGGFCFCCAQYSLSLCTHCHLTLFWFGWVDSFHCPPVCHLFILLATCLYLSFTSSLPLPCSFTHTSTTQILMHACTQTQTLLHACRHTCMNTHRDTHTFVRTPLIHAHMHASRAHACACKHTHTHTLTHCPYQLISVLQVLHSSSVTQISWWLWCIDNAQCTFNPSCVFLWWCDNCEVMLEFAFSATALGDECKWNSSVCQLHVYSIVNCTVYTPLYLFNRSMESWCKNL